jgi:hypothetical protein
MGRPKSFLPQLTIDRAERRHSCRQQDSHVILQGDARLTMKEGRDVKRYCLDCSIKFLSADQLRLVELIKELKVLRGRSGTSAPLTSE